MGAGPKPPDGYRGSCPRQVRLTQASVGSPECGDAPGRAWRIFSSADDARGSAEQQKADREKLNDERGIKPLLVSDVRDGAEQGTSEAARGRGELLYSAPRNRARVRSHVIGHPVRKLCRGGSRGHTPIARVELDPTDVTDVHEDQY